MCHPWSRLLVLGLYRVGTEAFADVFGDVPDVEGVLGIRKRVP